MGHGQLNHQLSLSLLGFMLMSGQGLYALGYFDIDL